MYLTFEKLEDFLEDDRVPIWDQYHSEPGLLPQSNYYLCRVIPHCTDKGTLHALPDQHSPSERAQRTTHRT